MLFPESTQDRLQRMLGYVRTCRLSINDLADAYARVEATYPTTAEIKRGATGTWAEDPAWVSHMIDAARWTRYALSDAVSATEYITEEVKKSYGSESCVRAALTAGLSELATNDDHLIVGELRNMYTHDLPVIVARQELSEVHLGLNSAHLRDRGSPPNPGTKRARALEALDRRYTNGWLDPLWLLTEHHAHIADLLVSIGEAMQQHDAEAT